MQKTDKESESLLWGRRGRIVTMGVKWANRYYGSTKPCRVLQKTFYKEKKKTDHNPLKKRINKK